MMVVVTKLLHEILNRAQISLPACVSFLNNTFHYILWEDFWLLQKKKKKSNLSYLLILIKIIHSRYPVNYEFAVFNSISPMCSFCHQFEETIICFGTVCIAKYLGLTFQTLLKGILKLLYSLPKNCVLLRLSEIRPFSF